MSHVEIAEHLNTFSITNSWGFDYEYYYYYYVYSFNDKYYSVYNSRDYIEYIVTEENDNITCELGFGHSRIKVCYWNDNRIKLISYYKYNKSNGLTIQYDVYLSLNDLSIKYELKYNTILYYYKNQTSLKFEITDLEKVSELLLNHREDPYNDEYETLILNYVVFT